MYPSPDSDQPLHPPDPARDRDRGLRRGRRLTRWIAVATVTGAAALGSLYTHLLPGGSTPAVPTNPRPHTPSASSAVAPKSGDDADHDDSARHRNDGGEGEGEDDDAGAAPVSQPAPHPPARSPAPTRQPPHTTTGAS
ncbi:hypothetical protein ACIO93_35015 [Streptomyces sp. NPDC087903]|uniref:hypothetical protein n=1 Tax=Streptomyces sp. NPDC087903 TaxID=3365819 RepID=UPI00381F252D